MSANESDRAITTLLERIAAGDDQARDQLFSALYPKLQELAKSALRRERPSHTLQPTALVNEASLKLISSKLLNESGNRASFFAAAARAMREVLVDHARARGAQKRPTGEQREKVALDDVVDELEANHGLDVLVLDECLQKLKSLDARKHEVVILRFFGGLKFKEIAKYLDVSLSTVEKDWHFSRAWLQRALSADSANGSSCGGDF
jgi:RNA polymerase sigma factor (TIGR02999 family)